MSNKKITLRNQSNDNKQNPNQGSGSETSPWFETEPITRKLEKVHYLVTNKDWQIRPACKFYSISESTYNRYKAKLHEGLMTKVEEESVNVG